MRRLSLCLMASVLTTAANSVSAQGQLPLCLASSNAAAWTNCFGTFTFLNGEKFVGEWKDNKFNGQGTYTWPNGQKFVGEFKDNKRSGQGTFTSRSGETYVGEFKDDKRHGQGILTVASGETYAGEWGDGKYHGPDQRLLAIQASAEQTSPQVSGRDMADRSLAILNLQAQIARQTQAYQERPRKRFIGANAREYRFAQYEEDWRAQIERVGTINYPAEARGKLYGNLKLTVTIRPDGTVASIDLNRSSGSDVLDTAAFRIVQMAAPFAAFPVDIRKDTDLLVITQTWYFAQGDKIRTEDGPVPVALPPLVNSRSVAAIRTDASGPDPAAVTRYRLELMEFVRRYRKYPRIALDNKWEGRADLLIGIGEDGSISTLTVDKSTGYESLDQEASSIVRAAKAKMIVPAALSGKAFGLEISVNFHLKDE